MIRVLALFLLISLFVSGTVDAQDVDVNVLSYYAVNNSLDGQLMVDMTNVLRFYPVFAMRDSTNQVVVSIYYGGSVFTRKADRMDGGRYWQTLLPLFKLGEAIQRLEVQAHFKLDNYFSNQFTNLQLGIGSVTDSLEQQLQNDIKAQLRTVDAKLVSNGIAYKHERKMRMSLQLGESFYKTTRDSIFERISRIPSEAESAKKYVTDSLGIRLSEIAPENSVSFWKSLENISKGRPIDTASIDKLIHSYIDLGIRYVSNYQKYKPLIQERSRIEAQIDSLKEELKESIEVGLIDTSYSGPSVRKSDLMIDNDFVGATILYRNYKRELRYMPTLDPGERMGIFRIRYVPFPITSVPQKNHIILHGPFGESFTVFEVGLAFGDAIVPGDEFVVPEFSIKRMGVAFAITEKLFSDSAEVMALALTYDFNSYGSIGVGGNFAQHEVHPYFSVGINKKAFEAVVGGLAGLFK